MLSTSFRYSSSLRALILISLAIGVPLNDARAKEPKNVLMIAGKPSHGFGSHEHYAGLKILEDAVASSPDINVDLVRGWPSDDALVQQADAIVIYCDGGKRHLATAHLDRLEKKVSEGCGLVCIHYAVETVPGEVGDRWLAMMGGHFEIDYSVNPHWVGEFNSLPEHPITNGVESFATNDEWYFHLRFLDTDRVRPILAAVAPPETMRRQDGHHSGNPIVRKSVAAGEPQTVAWAYDRQDGGRSFGFTGGHFHWNWANQSVRSLVVNAIAWSAKVEIPSEGIIQSDESIEFVDLMKNQDEEPGKKFNAEKVREDFGLGA